MDIRYAHGSQRCVQQVLERLGYTLPNTSAIERRNGTARRMSADQVRKSLAFSRRPDSKIALGWWGLIIYNWCRPHRSLRLALPEPHGKKSLNPKPPPWPLASLTTFGQPMNSCSHLYSRHEVRDNLMSLSIKYLPLKRGWGWGFMALRKVNQFIKNPPNAVAG
jgi:hypothetical protein